LASSTHSVSSPAFDGFVGMVPLSIRPIAPDSP
jgi:hypothetical protein